MIAARMANIGHGGDRRSDQAANLPLVSQAGAAESLQVSERSIRTAREVLDSGIPELIAECDAGKMPISIAAKIARLEPAAQQEFMTGPPIDAPASLRPHPRPEPAEAADYHDAARLSLKVINVLDTGALVAGAARGGRFFEWQSHYTADDFRGAGEWMIAFADRLEKRRRRAAL